jgi:hypothetical protein
VGLDEMGFTQDNLTKRRQSSTLRSHRLVYFVAKVRYPVTATALLASRCTMHGVDVEDNLISSNRTRSII